MTDGLMLTQCPSDDQLAALASGRLSGDALAAVESHLDACSICRQLFAAVSNGSTAAMRPNDRPMLRPGDLVGRYEIERLIGAGGMGVLYVARDPKLGRRVALKLMRPSLAAEGGRLRLLREAQAMAQLSHPNVVNVFDLGEIDGRVFVAMELLEGGTLRGWMKSPRSWSEVVEKFCEAGEGLAAAHASGVVHRDFKPENVMMSKGDHPKVGDFGLASPELVAEEELPMPAALALKVTNAGTMLGTPAYMSPEQLAGQKADARSDQYGFCVSLYEALAGQRPFPADSLEELRVRVAGGMPAPPSGGLVPAHVWAAIARGLNPDPAKRFPDLAALLTVLRFSAVSSPAQRLRRVKLIALAAGVFALGGAATWLRSSSPSRPSITIVRGQAEAPTSMNEQPAPPKAGASADEEMRVVDVSMQLGSSKTFIVRGLERAELGAFGVVKVQLLGDELRLTSVGAGNTTLLAWAGGRKTTYVIEVEGSVWKPSPLEVHGTVSVPVGGHGELRTPNLERIAVGDGDVARVQTAGPDTLMITGLREGKTTLIAWSNGTRSSYLISVLPKPVEVERTIAEIHRLMPDLQLRAVGDSVLVDGTVNSESAQRVVELMKLYPSIINLTRVGAQRTVGAPSN